MNAKHLNPQQCKALVYDIERGKATGILPEPWQTDTCLGDWHYQREIFDQHQYKSAATIIPMLADIVSKNGNLMLSVPIRGDGTIDSDEVKIVGDIGAWLQVNGELIYATRPWKVFGEGPSTKTFEKGQFDGQSDTHKTPFTPEDIRFTQSMDGRTLYAIVLGWPEDGKVGVKSLAKTDDASANKIKRVELLGYKGKLKFTQTAGGLIVELPAQKISGPTCSLKITGSNLKPVTPPATATAIRPGA